MFFNSHIERFGRIRPLSCAISSSPTRTGNHYITLGVTPAASQGEIKKAYFELCKLYHPDKNKGSAESAKKFRAVSEAYGVLGNVKTRREYDQKMCYSGTAFVRHQRPPSTAQNGQGPENMNLRTRNFRTHMGKEWYFNFEEWTNSHYPKMKQKQMRKEYAMGSQRHWKERNDFDKNVENNIFPFCMVLFGVLLLFLVLEPSEYYFNVSSFRVYDDNESSEREKNKLTKKLN